MKHTSKVLVIVLLLLGMVLPVAAQSPELPERSSDADHYRRSSLCLILLAHSDKQYAEAMTRVFSSFPMPERYNNHNIDDVRVVRVYGKQKREDIERILRENNVSRRLVERWFNRDAGSGFMNLDLIHERGGFGAFHDDYLRAQRTVRGVDLLREEGIELLENTYVLVCDMDYHDRSKDFRWGALAAGAASVITGVMGAAYEYQAAVDQANGNYSSANQNRNNALIYNSVSLGAGAGAAVLSDVGGFSVKIKAYLYHLKWDSNTTDYIYNHFWIDSETPKHLAIARNRRWETMTFPMEYLGMYKAKSGKTILRSWSNEDEVILDVCRRAVDKGINTLCKKYPVFRPRTPFIAGDGVIYSHIGTKEDVTPGAKYEVVRRERDRHGRLRYRRVAEVKALSVWNNSNVSFDRYFDPSEPGTCLIVTKGKFEDFAYEPGLQIREKK